MEEEEKIESFQQDGETQSPEESHETIASQKIIEPGPAIINEQPTTETMEVHHPHHVTHKKKFGEYLLEFFMLFLAVFLGFVAENIREHQVENNRELEYIKSLTADLNDDVNNLDAMIAFEKTGIKQLDTLITLLNDPALSKQNGDELYYAARQGPREQPFPVNSRTVDQLKSSGGFLLIKNVEASNKIISYYNQYTPVKLLEDNYNHEFDNYRRVAGKILNPEILRRQEDSSGNILRSNDNPSLLSYDDNLLKELGFAVVEMGGSRRGRLNMLQAQKQTAFALRNYLQKEYHLKDE